MIFISVFQANTFFQKYEHTLTCTQAHRHTGTHTHTHIEAGVCGGGWGIDNNAGSTTISNGIAITMHVTLAFINHTQSAVELYFSRYYAWSWGKEWPGG